MPARAVLLLISLFLFRCSFDAARKDQPHRVVTDDLGKKVVLPRQLKHVVSLVPSISEMICLLDCNKLIAGTRYDRFPEELLKRKREGTFRVIGGGFDPNIERIAKLRPDLIFADGPSQEKVTRPLKKLGFPVMSLDPKTLKEIEEDFLLLGELLGKPKKAKYFVASVRAQKEAIQEKTKKLPKKRVFVQTWADPILTPGKHSLTNEFLQVAGGENIFRDLPFSSGQVSLEAVIERNPEVVIFLEGLQSFAKKAVRKPEWKGIKAVQQGHICLIHGADLRPTIRYLDGIRKLFTCLHDFSRFPGKLKV